MKRISDTPVKFLGGLLCEDIRLEADGRFSLMGVITGDLTFTSEVDDADDPELDLAAFIQCEVAGSATIDVRLVSPDGELELIKSSGAFTAESEVVSPTTSPIPIQRRKLTIPMTGIYRLEARLEAGEWQLLNTLSVKINKG